LLANTDDPPVPDPAACDDGPIPEHSPPSPQSPPKPRSPPQESPRPPRLAESPPPPPPSAPLCESIVELTIASVQLERSALAREAASGAEPVTFLTLDFFDFDTQSTRLARGWATAPGQTFEFEVDSAEETFLSFCRSGSLRLDLHSAEPGGLRYRTLATAFLSLSRLLAAGAGEAQEEELLLRAGPTQQLVATMRLTLRLIQSVPHRDDDGSMKRVK
jgi:hypothetical protein